MALTVTLARVAAGGTRRGLMVERSGAERAATALTVLAAGAHRTTHYAPCGLFVQDRCDENVATQRCARRPYCNVPRNSRPAPAGSCDAATLGLSGGAPGVWGSGRRPCGAPSAIGLRASSRLQFVNTSSHRHCLYADANQVAGPSRWCVGAAATRPSTAGQSARSALDRSSEAPPTRSRTTPTPAAPHQTRHQRMFDRPLRAERRPSNSRDQTPTDITPHSLPARAGCRSHAPNPAPRGPACGRRRR